MPQGGHVGREGAAQYVCTIWPPVSVRARVWEHKTSCLLVLASVLLLLLSPRHPWSDIRDVTSIVARIPHRLSALYSARLYIHSLVVWNFHHDSCNKSRVSIPKEKFWLENQHENQHEIQIWFCDMSKQLISSNFLIVILAWKPAWKTAWTQAGFHANFFSFGIDTLVFWVYIVTPLMYHCIQA